MTNTNNPKSRDTELVVQNLNDEVLIYDLTVNKAYTLNEMSAAVWRLCDGQTSIREIAEQLSRQLNMQVGKEIVWLALDSFKKSNLLADGERVTIEFNGLSRRQVIRQVGLASLIALPVISSLIAPTAAHAASGVGTQNNGTTCTRESPPTSTECKSGRCTPTYASNYNLGTGINSGSPGGLKCCGAGTDGLTGSYTVNARTSGACDFSIYCCTGSGTEAFDTAGGVYYCNCAPTS